MDIETITKLLDAGYTKAEIDAIETGAKGSGAGDESGDNAGAAGEDNANDAQGGEIKTDEVAEMLKTLTDTVNGLTTTVKALQDANANGAKTKSPKATDEIKAAMDSFIEKL